MNTIQRDFRDGAEARSKNTGKQREYVGKPGVGEKRYAQRQDVENSSKKEEVGGYRL